MFVLTNPQGYVDFVAAAPIPVYRGIGLALVEPSPRAFGVFMLVLELVLALLILSLGRYVKLGLVGAVLSLDIANLPPPARSGWRRLRGAVR